MGYNSTTNPNLRPTMTMASYLPGTEKETPWHHDQAYYPVDGFKMVREGPI